MSLVRWICLALLVGAVAGCAGSQPAPASIGLKSASPRPTASSKEGAVQSEVPFGLISTAFEDGAPIPRQYTCDGQNISPDMNWRGAPADTAAFALTVVDPDAGGFVHWVAYNISGSASGGLPEGFSASPDAPPQGRNGMGKVGYGGPCPPSGTHHYHFTLFALDEHLELTAVPTIKELHAAINGHVLAETTLIGTYARG